jgi:peptidyl-prolyl cis-trans isomerase B (cyclophilin B)
MDIVHKIEDVEKGSSDKPIENVTIVDSGELPIEENEKPYRVEL